MKLALMFLLLLTPLAATPAEDKTEVFADNVDKGYSYYDINYNDWSTTDYSLIVVKGIYNGEACYGLCYVGVDENKYFLAIEYDDALYKFNTDSRGDSSAVAIKADKTYTIHILDEDGNEFNLKKSILSPFNTNNLDLTTMAKGSGNGGTYAELSVYTQTMPLYRVIIFVTITIIGACMLILLLLFLFKKGLFDKDKRRIGVVNVKEILNRSVDEKAYTEDNFWDGIDEATPNNTSKEINDEGIDYNNQPNKLKNSYDDEENSLITDIKKYLQELGYVTTYNILSEEEKNKVMLELMHLKDTGKITLKDYYMETGELWKK